MSEGPTDEQLENVALALGFPILPERSRPSYYRQSLLNLHSLVQRMADGDEDAARQIAALRLMFGKET